MPLAQFEIEAPNIPRINHEETEIVLDFAGFSNIKAIQIQYSGTMQAISRLPDGWSIMASSSKIICFNLGHIDPTIMLSYIGNIDIKGGNFSTSELKMHSFTVDLKQKESWENVNALFDSDTSFYTLYSDDLSKNKDIGSTTIIQTNLLTEENEFFYADGSPYSGNYYVFQDGQAFEGSDYSTTSAMIFRKKKSGELYKINNLKKRNLYNYKGAKQGSNILRLQELAKTGDESRYSKFVQEADRATVLSASASPDDSE